MKLTIEISENVYQFVMNTSFVEDERSIFTQSKEDRKKTMILFDILDAIRNGTPLPKGHGRLSDMDELVKNIVKEYGVNSIHELPQDIKMFYDKFINSAPIILDATFDYKLKNYAFFRKKEEK